MCAQTRSSSFFFFRSGVLFCFFFNDTATTEIYTLSLHDALPIYHGGRCHERRRHGAFQRTHLRDRKSTRLNSSHANISYAVFCLKKKHQPRIAARSLPGTCPAATCTCSRLSA